MATLDNEIRIIAVKGQKGDAGSSIASIEKTATSGKTDTYTITLTDGSTTTFQVTNGEVTLEQFESELSDIEGEVTALEYGGTNRVKMVSNNTDGTRYILTTDNNTTSGGKQTPQYSPLFYINGDNSGLFLLDDFNAQDFYYWDSDEETYISVKEKLNEKKYVHNISFIEWTNYVFISLIYISNSQTPLTQSTLLSTLAGGTYSVSGRKSNNQVYKATITSSQIILYGYEDAEYVVDMTLVNLTDYVYEI